MHEKERDIPSPEGLVFSDCRQSVGWTQREAELECGLGRNVVSQWETGKRDPSPEDLYRTTAVMGADPEVVDLMLLFYRQVSRRPLPPAPQDLPWGVDAEDCRSSEQQAAAFALRLSRSQHELQLQHLSRLRLQEARVEADRLYRRLMTLPKGQRGSVVRHHSALQTWLVVERLCEASEKAAPKDPKEALHLANLALSAARSAIADEKVRCRMQGYAWIFIGNAHRVGSDLRTSDEAFSQAETLWSRGAGAEGVLLEEWRIFDGKAVLRKDQRRWQDALALHGEALKVAPRKTKGRILVSKASALEQMGAAEAALKVLGQARPLIDPEDHALLFAWRFGLTVNLVHVGRVAEAARHLPELRRMATALGRVHDLARIGWLHGRIAGESGSLGDAIEAISQARLYFTENRMPFDAGMAAMDESVYSLAAGNHRHVRALSGEILWIFGSEGIQQEGMKALRLFCSAAQSETLTAELVRSFRDRLRSSA